MLTVVVEFDVGGTVDFQPAEFVIKWQYPLMVPDDGLNPQKLKTAISRGAVYTVKDLLKILVTEDMTTKELKETAMETTGMSESAFYGLVKELKETPGITFTAKGKEWNYTVPQTEPRLT